MHDSGRERGGAGAGGGGRAGEGTQDPTSGARPHRPDGLREPPRVEELDTTDAQPPEPAAVAALRRAKAHMQYRRRCDALGVPEVAGAQPSLTTLFRALLAAEGPPSHEELGNALAIHPTLLGDLALGNADIPHDVAPEPIVRLARASGLDSDEFYHLLERDWADASTPEPISVDQRSRIMERYGAAWRFYEQSDAVAYD